MQVAMDTKFTAATMFALSAASASLLWRARSSKECRAATQFPKTLALFKTVSEVRILPGVYCRVYCYFYISLKCRPFCALPKKA